MATKAKTKKATWFNIIDAAKKRGAFTEAEIEKAMEWQTCACGSQGKFFFNPHDISDGPWDDELNQLGGDFYEAVGAQDFKLARDLMTKIEKRASYLFALFNGNQKAVNYMLSGSVLFR